jgi:hypothetical protein
MKVNVITSVGQKYRDLAKMCAHAHARPPDPVSLSSYSLPLLPPIALTGSRSALTSTHATLTWPPLSPYRSTRVDSWTV